MFSKVSATAMHLALEKSCAESRVMLYTCDTDDRIKHSHFTHVEQVWCKSLSSLPPLLFPLVTSAPPPSAACRPPPPSHRRSSSFTSLLPLLPLSVDPPTSSTFRVD
eukprot:488462-Rhodomonas_salina.1